MKALILSLFLFSCPKPSISEIRRFDGPINAASNYVHFSEGFIVTPGYVDVSELLFETADDGDQEDMYVPEERWDDGNLVEEEDDFISDEENEGTDDEEGNRRLDGEDANTSIMSGSTFVDIAFFHEPLECANTRLGCDWTELGVGASDGEGNLRWCCSDDAAALGLCHGGPKQEGRLIVDPKNFLGQHRFLGVPPSGEWHRKVGLGKFDLKNSTSGKYVLVIANCNDVIGRNLTVSGEYTWKSVHGYLPGNLFGEMYFFVAIMGLYLVLFLWYAIMMCVYSEEAIPIQKWVISTIGIGLLETFFKSGDLWVWNVDGERFWFSLYTGVIFGVLKRAISRCLVVMVSLGWGVTSDTLGEKMKSVVGLGLIYAGVSSARDVMNVLAITENEILSEHEENELLDVVTVLTFVAALIDVTFYMWIFDALSGTMQYLESMNQSMKLKRYLRLRFILLLSVLFAFVWTVFGIVDSYNDQRMVNEEEYGWVLGAAVWEANYLLVLVVLSCLWAPEAGAKEYAFVMELPSLGDDLEFDTTVADSPEEEDENDAISSGYSDEPNKSSGITGDDLETDKGAHA